jgi:hypothetical protein
MEIIRPLKVSALAVIALAMGVSCGPHSESSLLGSQRTDVFFPFVEQVIQPERIVAGEWTEITLIVSCARKPEVLYGRKVDDLHLEQLGVSENDYRGSLWIYGPLLDQGPERHEYQVPVMFYTPGEKTLSLNAVANAAQGGAQGTVIGSADEVGGIHIMSDVDLVTRQFDLTVVPGD